MNMHQPGAPSVEEILESIKKVIARDQRRLSGHPDAGLPDTDPAPAPFPADVLDLACLDALQPDRGEGEAAASGAPLLGDAARSSMRDSLAALAMLSEPAARPRVVRSGETSLEDLTRELLRPALAEWLDRNLPALVERLVAAEIARIVGKQG